MIGFFIQFPLHRGLIKNAWLWFSRRFQKKDLWTSFICRLFLSMNGINGDFHVILVVKAFKGLLFVDYSICSFFFSLFSSCIDATCLFKTDLFTKLVCTYHNYWIWKAFFFMNWCHIIIQVAIFCKASVTNTAFESFFLRMNWVICHS